MKLKLTKPVVLKGKEDTFTEITELTFREEICAGDLRGCKLGSFLSIADCPVEDLLKLAGRLCAQPDPVMNGLSFADLGEVVALVSVFMQAGQSTGKSP